MADRWQDDRDRQFRDREMRRTTDYRPEPYGRREERTFGGGFGEPGRDRSQGQDRVFGERESGADYGRGGGSPVQTATPRSDAGRQAYGEGSYRSQGASGGEFQRGPRYADENGDWQANDHFGGETADRGGRAGAADTDYWGQRSRAGAPSGGTGGYDYDRGYGDAGRRGGSDDDRHDRGGDFLGRAGEKLSSWFSGGGNDADRSHRGRGPKGYKRSDARIDEDIHERLTADHWLDASHIDVKVANGEVTLSGTVDSREAKRRAEEIAERCSGVDHIQNNLRVQRDGAQAGTAGASPEEGAAPNFRAPAPLSSDASKKLS